VSDTCEVPNCGRAGPLVRGLCLTHAEEALSGSNGHSRRANRRAYYLKNEAMLKAKTADWYRKNKERAANYQREYRAREPLTYLISHKRRRGLTYKDAQLQEQGGVCDVCGGADPMSSRGWHLDHDHAFDSKGGERNPISLRGVLCATCNQGLVSAAEASPRYRALMPPVDAYLSRWAATIERRLADAEQGELPLGPAVSHG
jgi:hypothetical protein